MSQVAEHFNLCDYGVQVEKYFVSVGKIMLLNIALVALLSMQIPIAICMVNKACVDVCERQNFCYCG